MKNQYLHPNTLRDNSEIFNSRAQQLPTLVNNLKLKDVEEDEAFEKTKKRIKDTILIKPIVLSEAKFIDFEYKQKEVRMEQRFFGNPSSDNYIHEIRIPFEGDRELFVHSFNGMSYSSSDHGVIKPQSSSYATVYAELSELSPEKAISSAESLFKLTKYIGESNSKLAENWNAAMEQQIDQKLEAKRDELFRIFKKS